MNMTVQAAIFMWPVIIVGVVLYYLPLIARPGIFFGATVEPSFPRSSEGRRLLRGYRWQVGLWVIAAMVITGIFAPGHPLLGSMPPLFVLLAAVGFSYRRTFREVHTHYGIARAELRQARLAPVQQRPALRVGFVLPPFLALGFTALYLHLHWSEIPERFPVHWGMDGQPNGWAARDWHGVYGLVLMGVALDLFMLGLAWALARFSRNNVMRYVAIRGLEVLLYPLTLTFVVSGLLPLMKSSPATLVLFTVVVMLLTIAGIMYWAYRKISAPSAEDATPEPVNDNYWKAGMFYYNPDDPAIFVAKRVGIGYTPNFAHKVVWLVLAGTLIAAFLPALLLLRK